MTVKELKNALTEKAGALVEKLYGDSGKRTGRTYAIGNVQGEPGQSLVIYINDGAFKDMSTGERGDMLELLTLKLGSKAAAIKEAYSFLGISNPMATESRVRKTGRTKQADDDDVDQEPEPMKKKSEWRKPVADWEKIVEGSEVFKYLTEERKIEKSQLTELRVRQVNDKEYCFLTYTHGDDPEICGANYISLERTKNKDGKLKKIIRQQPKPFATLFGHPECEMGVKNKDGKTFVIITEGQIDCLSFRTQGVKNVVSIPMGTGNEDWINHSWDWLEKFELIYICFDNDPAGHIAREKAAKKLNPDRCKYMCITQYNDANDALINGDDLWKYIDTARVFMPSSLVTALDISQESIAIAAMGRRELIGDPFMGWVDEESIDFRLRPKEWTIWTGYPGHGKSNMLYQFIAYCVFVLNQKIAVASLEEDVTVILNLITIHAMAMQYTSEKHVHKAWLECHAYIESRVFFYKHRGRAKVDGMLKDLESTVRRHGVSHVIIDSVAKTDLNIEDNEKANEFVNLISTSVDDTGAHYHILAHPRKGDEATYEGIPTYEHVKGASAFGVECFNCITIWRNKMKNILLKKAREYAATGGFRGRGKNGEEKIHTVASCMDREDNLIVISKQKVGGQVGQFKLYYDTENYRFHRNQELITNPYAKDIYNHYILNRGRKVVDEF